MLLGIISDTHIDSFDDSGIPAWVLKAFDNVDLILHAGDITSEGVLLELESLAPVEAVRGNSDLEVTNLPAVRTVLIPNYGKIVLAHQKEAALHFLESVKCHGKIRGIVYGHTHRPSYIDHSVPWLLNPGSPLRPRNSEPSVALLKTTQEEIEVTFKFKKEYTDE